MKYLGSISNDADLVNKKYVDDNISAVVSLATAALPTVRTVTLESSDWLSDGTIEVAVTGMTSTASVIVAPDPAYYYEYTDAEIVCDAQTAGYLGFTSGTTPPAIDIDVNVIFWS